MAQNAGGAKRWWRKTLENPIFCIISTALTETGGGGAIALF